MNVIMFGASGMVGQGALRECLADPEVQEVLSVGRSATGQQHPKLKEIIHANLLDLSPIERDLTGYHGCLFCLGVTSAGMSEARYASITYDLTMSVAQTLVRLDPGMTFIFVSGAGTDSSEHGRIMWARVKGKTENALLRLPFKAAYMFRPGGILPMHGITSKTTLYRIGYAVATPLYPLLKKLFPNSVTTSEQLGRAMLRVAKNGYPKPVLEGSDINAVGAGSPS
jgi:uncharacterized protein YbjT (DUF2867 family)